MTIIKKTVNEDTGIRPDAVNESVMDIRDFSCPGISGFTFKYPVFKNWEDIKIKKIDKDSCTMEIGWSGFAEIPPSASKTLQNPVRPAAFLITIKRSKLQDPEFHSAAVRKNPQGTYYRFLDVPKDFEAFLAKGPITANNSNKLSRNFIEFYGDQEFIKMESPNIGNQYGFSELIFWITIEESFTLTNAYHSDALLQINIEDARELAMQKINEHSQHKMVILEIKQKPDGWIFYYDAEEAVKTDNRQKYGVPGNIPLFISKDGIIKYISNPNDSILN